MKLRKGLLFTGKYFIGIVKVLEIKESSNELEVRCEINDHNSIHWWFEIWDLKVVIRGFDTGDYFITPELAKQNDLNDPIMKPSLFLAKPLDSVMQNGQSETIAHNIMAILARTGDKFRDLSWEEYQKERKKDGNFSTWEKDYFDKMIYLAKGSFRQITSFCRSWKSAYAAASNKSKPNT